ncbi:hypothetical protein [Streptomyces sp. G45]
MAARIPGNPALYRTFLQVQQMTASPLALVPALVRGRTGPRP